MNQIPDWFIIAQSLHNNCKLLAALASSKITNLLETKGSTKLIDCASCKFLINAFKNKIMKKSGLVD